jgi:predicted RNA methylase
MSHQSRRDKVEYGDFQTPAWFSAKICSMLVQLDVQPATVIEPTCGRGSFLLAALESFPGATAVLGADINPDHIAFLREQLAHSSDNGRAKVFLADFFATDWQQILERLPEPILIVGNPPWVTNSELASMSSQNLPVKSNFQNHAGIEAITGAANFDISEWVLLKTLEWVQSRHAVIAMLCKTAVARKVLRHIWQRSSNSGQAAIYAIDAAAVFGVAVDACLFVYDTRKREGDQVCAVYPQLKATRPSHVIGFQRGQLIANQEFYGRWHHLDSPNTLYQWRSGIKHDCAKVMELVQQGNLFTNQLGETWQLESDYTYPMMKSSDIASPAITFPSRWMLVTQQYVGDNTLAIKIAAPQTWRYLNSHSNLLDCRKSIIYRNRPRFSVFGVGEYTFTPWKVAISSMYKKLTFVAVGPYRDRPVVLDDTCYFLPCHSESEAQLLEALLNSKPAQEFLRSLIFWDAKRPITIKILQRLDLPALARLLGREEELLALINLRPSPNGRQLQLLEKQPDYT